MKSLLSISVAVFVLTPALFADESKSSDKAKADACCEEKAKATSCSSAKGSCCAKEAAALRQALLTHKGAWLAQR